MARISQQTIEQVTTIANVVDVVSEYVDLKQAGRSFKGLCPFHDEKTPSFSVNADKGIYKCFGCGAGGGAVNFIMQADNLEFPDAIIKLANMFNIKIDFDESDKRFSDLRTQLLSINTNALNFYKDNLNSDIGTEVHQYLSERGFTKEIINEFKLGYINNQSNALLKLIQKEKYSSDAMKESGLFYNGKNGYVDSFRSRLIFPIMDRNENTIGFAGRVFNNDHPAKYINSQDTILYNKSKVLFGLNKAIQEIKNQGNVIIVEGYFDLMQLFQSGIKNVVAICGTAFTDYHAAILKRHTKEIYIALDGDISGQNSAIKTGYILLKNGMQPKIIQTPKGLDPDDWIQQKGNTEFKEYMQSAIEVMQFHHDVFQTNDQNKNIQDFINQVLSEIVLFNDAIIKEISAKNLSDITGISTNSILESLNTMIDKNNRIKKIRENKNKDIKPIVNNQKTLIEDDLMRLCLCEDLEIRTFIYNNLNSDWIQSNAHKELYEHINIHLKSQNEMPIKLIMNQISDKETSQRFANIIYHLETFEASTKMAKDCLIRLEKIVLEIKLNSIREQLKQDDENLDIIKQIASIKQEIINLNNKYN